MGAASIPFDGIMRTIVAVIFYLTIVAHLWEMNEGLKLCQQHRADAVTTVRRVFLNSDLT